MRTILCIAALAATACLVTPREMPAEARLVAENLSRQQIRSMPMLERPDRPIHFYGNAVRRRHRTQAASPVRSATPR